MPNSMKIKVYTALWKFCFCMPDDPDCKENRKINRMALSILSQDASLDILTVIKNAKNKFTVSGDEVSIKTLIVYLSSHVKVYNILSEEVIHHIDSVLSNDDECKLISWFKFNSLNEHLNYILTLDKIYSSAKPIQMLTEHYIKIGEKELLIDFYIHLYGVSQLYDIADNRFDMYISPNLSEMSKSQVEHLIKVSSNNDQIFARRRAYRCNTMIVEKCKGVLGENFDYDNLDYSFNFDKKILDDDIIENHNDSADFYDEDGELLF